MTDIPFFPGYGCLSSLALGQISDKKTAYILVRTIEPRGLEAHLRQAAELCRAAGAAQVYAGSQGEPLFSSQEPAYRMLLLNAPTTPPIPDAPEFVPLSENNARAFADIYNSCFLSMPSVPMRSAEQLPSPSPELSAGLYRLDGCFAALAELRLNGKCAELTAVAVLKEYRGGFGSRVVAAELARAGELGAASLDVCVMSTNIPALKMYEKLGFLQKGLLSTWFLLD